MCATKYGRLARPDWYLRKSYFSNKTFWEPRYDEMVGEPVPQPELELGEVRGSPHAKNTFAGRIMPFSA